METWLPVLGWEGLYSVSSDGFVRRDGGRILRGRPNPKGYLRVVLHRPGVAHSASIHRLVAESFLGGADPREVNHLDGDKSNNRAHNLEWATPRQNSRHAVGMGLRASKRGSLNGRARLSPADIDDIRTSPETALELADRFGVARNHIYGIRSGKYWPTT